MIYVTRLHSRQRASVSRVSRTLENARDLKVSEFDREGWLNNLFQRLND